MSAIPRQTKPSVKWWTLNVIIIIINQSLNREGRWGTTDDFATSLLHFSLFSSALWDLGELQACTFPDVVFPPLLLSALSVLRPFSFQFRSEKRQQHTAVYISKFTKVLVS